MNFVPWISRPTAAPASNASPNDGLRKLPKPAPCCRA
jgi:hypothetical protein